MQETITGVLTKEPEIRYSEKGLAQTKLEMKDQDGNIIEVACYGQVAENVALSLNKGHSVTVIGNTPPTVFQATEVAVSLQQATVEVHRQPKHWED